MVRLHMVPICSLAGVAVSTRTAPTALFQGWASKALLTARTDAALETEAAMAASALAVLAAALARLAACVLRGLGAAWLLRAALAAVILALSAAALALSAAALAVAASLAALVALSFAAPPSSLSGSLTIKRNVLNLFVTAVGQEILQRHAAINAIEIAITGHQGMEGCRDGLHQFLSLVKVSTLCFA